MAWNDDNKELKASRDRDRHLKNKYGVQMMLQYGSQGTVGYNMLRENQDYKCLFCGETEKHDKHLIHEHCHSSEKIRGLVCSRCNTAIGGYEFVMSMGKEKIEEYFGTINDDEDMS